MGARFSKAGRALLVALACACGAGAAWPGPFDDAMAAYKRGDHYQAWRQLKPLAEAGDAAAQSMFASLYKAGQGTVKNDAVAFDWYKRAAEQGDLAGQVNLGTMYLHGEGVAEDDAEAAKFLKLGAEKGDSTAQYWLGQMYKTGKGVVANDAEALRLNRLSAQQGDTNAECEYAVRAVSADAVAKITWVDCHQKAAEQGIVFAQTALGFAFQNGDGIGKSPSQALVWFRKAAEAGDENAQIQLARIYQRGDGVTKDNREAAKWYRQAAEHGSAWAQSELGALLVHGDGVPQDLPEATKWLTAAAGKGFSQSADLLKKISHFSQAAYEADMHYAEVQMKDKDYAKAADLLQPMLDADNQSLTQKQRARALNLSGTAYYKNGRSDLAAPQLAAALVLDPSYKDEQDLLTGNDPDTIAYHKRIIEMQTAYAKKLEEEKFLRSQAQAGGPGGSGGSVNTPGATGADPVIEAERARRRANCARAAQGANIQCTPD